MSEEREIYYKKVGRRYKPVAYDIPHFYAGVATLVMSDKNCTSYIHAIEPDTAPLRAAKEIAIRKVVEIVRDAAEATIHNKPSDAKLLAAWKAYCDVLGDDRPMHYGAGSHYDVAAKIVDAMFEAAMEIESHD